MFWFIFLSKPLCEASCNLHRHHGTVFCSPFFSQIRPPKVSKGVRNLHKDSRTLSVHQAEPLKTSCAPNPQGATSILWLQLHGRTWRINHGLRFDFWVEKLEMPSRQSSRADWLNLHFLPKHQWLFLWSSRVRNIKKMKPLEAQVTNSLLQKLPIVRMHRSSCMNHSMLIITSSKTGSIPTLSGRTLCTGSCSLICNSIGFCIPSSKLKFSGTRMRNPTAFGLTMWRNPKQFNGISHFSETG